MSDEYRSDEYRDGLYVDVGRVIADMAFKKLVQAFNCRDPWCDDCARASRDAGKR